jgi:O-antigen ligase
MLRLMEVRNPKIYNTVTVQEIIVLSLVFLLFAAQPFGFGGPRIPLFVLVGIGICFFIQNKLLSSQIGILRFAVICVLLEIPSLISYWNTYSILKTTQIVLAVPAFFFAGALIYSLFCNRRAEKIVVALISITSILWVLDGLFQYFFGKDVLGHVLHDGIRVTGPFFETLHMGSFLTALLPVTLKWLSRFGWQSQLMYVCGLSFVIVTAGIRADWVTCLVAVFLFYVWTKGGRKLLFFGVVPSLLIIFLVSINTSSIANIKAQQTTNISITYEGLNNVLSKRLDIWSASLNMATDHPFTGIGAGAFNHAYSDYCVVGARRVEGKFPYHAHHPWFSILGETGWIGIAGLVGIIGFLILWTRQSPYGFNLYHYPWLLVLVLMLNPLNAMPILFSIWWFPIFLLATTAHLAHLASDQFSFSSNE